MTGWKTKLGGAGLISGGVGAIIGGFVADPMNGEMMSGLIAAAGRVDADPSVRAVVLSGAGPSFCAGLDSANFGEMASGELSASRQDVQEAYGDLSAGGANRAQQVGWAWHELAVPVIAAVHGNALGGGLNLVLAADLRVVAPDATFGFVEITWGLIPDMSDSQSLRRLVGVDRAKRVVLTGERFTGAEAAEWGLATELADEPLARATALAQSISSHNPEAVRAALVVLDAAIDADTADGLATEASRSSKLIGTPNQIEAVVAQLEGRTAVFEDPDVG